MRSLAFCGANKLRTSDTSGHRPQLLLDCGAYFAAAGCLCLSDQIIGQGSTLAEECRHRSFDLLGGPAQSQIFVSRAQPVQHHLHRQNRRQGIRLVLSGVLWRAAMNRLKHRMLIADIAADGKPQSPRRRRSVVADDVSHKIRTHHHVIPFRVANLPLTEGIYISEIERKVRELTCTNLAEYFAEKAVCANDV